MLKYECAKSREEWLKKRAGRNGIGASEAAAVCGLSKWKTPAELWEEKTGRKSPKDLSDVEYVQLGVRCEGPMRDLFGALNPGFLITYRPYDMLYQTERPWLFATLDGELTDLERQERGILEIKKFEIQSREDWKSWNGQIPDYYYTQICHQFLACGEDFQFAMLWALILSHNGNGSLRPYYFRRTDCEEDMEWLLEKEEKFMADVKADRPPAVPLTI